MKSAVAITIIFLMANSTKFKYSSTNQMLSFCLIVFKLLDYKHFRLLMGELLTVLMLRYTYYVIISPSVT